MTLTRTATFYFTIFAKIIILVTKLENDQKLYTLSVVFKEYLRIYHH
jgi:hypothetical protein